MSYYKVSYDKLFPYAAFLNERIGIEILVEHNQDPLEALEEARRIVHDFRNKHIQAELSHQYEPVIEKIPDVQKEDITTDYNVVIEEINKCKSINELDGWNFIAKGNHEAGMVFAKKAAELLSPKNAKLNQLKKIKP